MLRARDTTDAAFELQLMAYRAMSPNDRLAIGVAMSDEIRALTKAGIRDRHPEFTDAQLADALAEIMLGPELAEKIGRTRPATTP